MATTPTAPAGPTRPRRHRTPDRERGLRTWALGLWAFLAIAFLLAPVAFMVVFGFNDNQGRFNIEWQGFTLKHWGDAFDNADLTNAFKNSLTIAVLSTIAATTLGTFLALALGRFRFRGKSVAEMFVFLPMATPEVVMGASLLAMFLVVGVSTGYATILIAHIMFSISYVVVTVRSRLAGMDPHIEEAARDLGAGELTTFFRITLPMILPGVLAAAVLAFALSLDDYAVTSFNNGQTTTLPLYIFGAARQGVPPTVNVLSTLLLLTVLVLMAVNLGVQKGLARRDRGDG
ncbi:MAG: ABC transporter permease [Solirubrobacteraceae bacterium]